MGQKEKTIQVKTDNLTQGNKAEGTGERNKTKNIMRQGKTIETTKQNSISKTRENEQRHTNNRITQESKQF